MVGLGRLELPTPRLSSVCSNQLSYKPLKKIYLKGYADGNSCVLSEIGYYFGEIIDQNP